MYISFLFFCHLCLLYFTVRVEQSAIHARGCCFCHPSTFQNPGPQSAKWTHPKKFLLNKSPMEVHPDISAEPMNSVNFRVKFQLSTAFLPFPLPFGLSGSTQAFAGPIWAASLSLVNKTNPHAHRIVFIFSFSSWGPSRIRMNIWWDLIQFASSHHKSRHHWPSHCGFTSTAAKVCIHRHKDTTWLTSNVAQHGTALEVFHRNNTARPSSKPAIIGGMTSLAQRNQRKNTDLKNSQTSQTSNYVVKHWRKSCQVVNVISQANTRYPSSFYCGCSFRNRTQPVSSKNKRISKLSKLERWRVTACDTNPMRGRPNKVDAVTASPTWLRHLMLMILISTWFRMPQTGLVQDLRWKFYIVKQRLIGKAAPQSCSLADRTAPFSPPQSPSHSPGGKCGKSVELMWQNIVSTSTSTSCPWRQSHSFLHCSQHETHHLWTEHLSSNGSVLYPSSALFEKGVWMLKLFKRCLPLLLLGFLQETPCGLVHEIHTARTVTSWSCSNSQNYSTSTCHECTECTGRVFLQSPVVPCAAFQKVESSKPSTPRTKSKEKQEASRATKNLCKSQINFQLQVTSCSAFCWSFPVFEDSHLLKVRYQPSSRSLKKSHGLQVETYKAV